MIKYRLDCMVDDAHLATVMAVIMNAGMESEYDPDVRLSVPGSFSSDFPKNAPLVTGVKVEAEKEFPRDYADQPSKAKPPAKRKIHAQTNGAEWPPQNSIYHVVLQALKEKPHTAVQLRPVLEAGGFSAASVNSALVRLEKRQKAVKGPDGWAAAA